MRVAVVSQYFPPEVGATQNRMATFVDGLAGRGHQVTVYCEQPNHPAGVFQLGYGRRPLMRERSARRRVVRVWVAASPRKTQVRRLAFYGSFAAWSGLLTGLGSRQDVVFATSPPLPGALSAAAAARVRRMPYVLDVRDLWPAAAEALGELSNRRVLAWLERAESWMYRHAHAVTATTQPFCRHIDSVARRHASVHLPNGALDVLLDVDGGAQRNGCFTVGYVGNHGIAQGLGIVLDAAERLHDPSVRFILVGEGPVKAELAAEASERLIPNVEFRDGVPLVEAGRFLRSCDALLIPLRDHPLLADFIPSKLYDAMAVGRPVIVAARGEAAALVRRHGCGFQVDPESGAELAAAVMALRNDPAAAERLGSAGRKAARGYVRSAQVDRLEQVLLTAANFNARQLTCAE